MPDSPTHRVLVIEDDPDMRENLRDILAMDGCEVETAATLAEVASRTDWSGFWVIILDWRLPDGDARALLPELTRLAPDAGVIISTGTRDLDGAILALRHGAVDYILKPINADALRASVRRILRQKQSDQALRTSQRRMQALFDCTLDAILLIDDEGTPVDANPAALALFGRTRSEMLEAPVRTLISPRSQSVFDDLWSGFLSDGRRSRELKIRRGNEEVDVEYHAVAHVLPGLHLSVLRDVTERRQAQEQLLQAGRLAAIGEAMAGLAHESRNALQRSQACLEMLSRRVGDRPEAADLIARVQRAQDDLHRLYEEVREYAAPVRLSMREIRLDDSLRSVWDELSIARRGRDARMRFLSGPAATCEADSFSLRQVFRNILENSLSACADPVEIDVSIEETRFRSRPAVTVSIQDNGPGMTPEQRQKIFEPFFTTKTHGTGLGMAIARRIVEAHGGEIRVGDSGHPGALLLITLPRFHP